MGEKVMEAVEDHVISWVAPIVPSVSMAGIRLGMNVDELTDLLSRYAVDVPNRLFRFEMSPILQLKRSESDGDEVFLFSVYDRELTNWRLFFDRPDHAGANPRALAVLVRGGEVYAVKAWHFEKLKNGDRPRNIYAGKIVGHIGLGDYVADLLPYVNLTYDDAEEWLYADGEFEGVEITGWGTLEEYPDQIIMAVSVCRTR